MGEYEKERWRKPDDTPGDPGQRLASADAVVLAAVETALARLSYGAILLTVHDGHVVQLDVTEKQRFQSRN